MRAYLAYIQSTLRLTLRDRLVLFFNYLFPLIIFGGLGEGLGAKVSGGAAAQLFTMVLLLGALGNGFFGGGMRAVLEREQNILRRFKVAPISAGPIIAASLVVGWLVFMPSVFFFWILSIWRYQLDPPAAPFSLLAFISIGVITFRSLGMIVAAVVNSMQESQILVQLLYLPMLMLSGATVPLEIMPEWLQSVAQFIPSTHMYLGLQGILVRGETLAANWQPALALIFTTAIASFLSLRLFRWEKEERLKASAKFWILAAMLPIVLAGGWQVWRGSNFAKTQALARERSRTISWLIHDARLFLGDGTVIERGALLIRKGKIVQIFEGAAPAASSLRAEPVEASGKTVLPGFIDSLTFLGYEAGPGRPASKQAIERALKAYLYCGIVALRDQTALIPLVRDAAAAARRGEIAGPEVFPTPPAGNLAGVPLLNAQDIRLQLQEGQTSFLEGSLVQQVLPAGSVEPLRQAAARWRATQTPLFSLPGDSVAVLAGSGSGASEFEPHGPLLHRELQLWVRQGISPRDALLAATTRGALVIGASQRLGRLAPGFEASLLVVEGNPLTDISTTERIWRVFFKGEMVSRSALFEQRGY